jgi:hypothetical protein
MPDQTSALNAMRMLDLLQQFFGPNGEHWLQYGFRDRRERRCLVAAIAHLRRKHRIRGDGTSWFICEVIRFRHPALSATSLCEAQLRDRLMFFNDHRCKSFAELRAVLTEARVRAAQEFCHAAAQTAADTQREAAPPTDDAEQKRLAAVAARWDLITQVQFERKSAAVRRITRDTYILCPRAPEPQPEPLRLAA